MYTNVTISLVDSLNGFEMDIEHLDGHKVSTKSVIFSCTKGFEVYLTLKNQMCLWCWHYSEKGNHFVEINFMYPCMYVFIVRMEVCVR